MKNIILIITDTFRYDNLLKPERRLVNTPELDKFMSERATSITNFYTGSFPTIPQRTDLATGRLGWPHYGWQPITKSSENHIGNMLRENGYATQLICDCPHLVPANFAVGFDAYFQHRGQEGDTPLLNMNKEAKNVMPNEKTRDTYLFKDRNLANHHRWINRYFEYEDQTFSMKTSQSTVRWLEENHEGNPFFLWVDFFDPHEPWDPPEYLVKKYDAQYDGTPMIHPNYGRSSDYTDEELHNLWAHYAAEAELVDRSIGRILQKVDDLGLWEDSIVVITSDHGISIGEHTRTGKTNINTGDNRHWPIYPEIGHVPFLIAGPGVPAQQSLDIFAQPVDILPTLAELAQVSVNPKEDIQGKSFAKCLSSGSPHRDFAVCGSFLPSGQALSESTSPFYIDHEWGYAPVGPDGQAELFHIQDDPNAERNVISDHMDKAKEIHAKFVDYLKEYEAPQHMLDHFGG